MNNLKDKCYGYLKEETKRKETFFPLEREGKGRRKGKQHEHCTAQLNNKRNTPDSTNDAMVFEVFFNCCCAVWCGCKL